MAPKRSYDDALFDLGDHELNFDESLFSNKKLRETNDGFDLTTYLISDSTLAEAVVPTVQALEAEVVSGALNPWLSPGHVQDDSGESSPASPAFQESPEYLSDDPDGDFSSLFGSPSHILSSEFDASFFDSAFDDTFDDVLDDSLPFDESVVKEPMPETMVLSSGASILLPKGTTASAAAAARSAAAADSRSSASSLKSKATSKTSSSKFKISTKIPFPSSLNTRSIPVPPPSSSRLPCTSTKASTFLKKSNNSGGSTLKNGHSATTSATSKVNLSAGSGSLCAGGLFMDQALAGGINPPVNTLRWAHNSTERKRRLEIRRLFSGLRDLFPDMLGDDKVSNINTLNRAIDNVAELSKRSVEQEGQLKMLRQRNNQLKARLTQIRAGKGGDVSAISFAPVTPSTVSKMTTGGVVVSLTSSLQAPATTKSSTPIRSPCPPPPNVARGPQTSVPTTRHILPTTTQPPSKKFAPIVPKLSPPMAHSKVPSRALPVTAHVQAKTRAPNVPSANPVTSSRTTTVSSIVARAGAINSAAKPPSYSAPRVNSPKPHTGSKPGTVRAPTSNTTSVQNARAAGSASAIRSAAMIAAAKNTAMVPKSVAAPPKASSASALAAPRPIMCMGKAPVVGMTRAPVIVSKAPVVSTASRVAASILLPSSASAPGAATTTPLAISAAVPKAAAAIPLPISATALGGATTTPLANSTSAPRAAATAPLPTSATASRGATTTPSPTCTTAPRAAATAPLPTSATAPSSANQIKSSVSPIPVQRSTDPVPSAVSLVSKTTASVLPVTSQLGAPTPSTLKVVTPPTGVAVTDSTSVVQSIAEKAPVGVEISAVTDCTVDKKAVPAAIRQLMDHNSRGPQECKPLARRRPKTQPIKA